MVIKSRMDITESVYGHIYVEESREEYANDFRTAHNFVMIQKSAIPRGFYVRRLILQGENCPACKKSVLSDRQHCCKISGD